MADIVTPDVRSRMMSGIRGKNTRPEIAVRKEMYHRGYRYRLHAKELAGKPDIVFPRFHAVVFVHGCFWHGHSCSLFKMPSTRPDFWKAKIDRNRQNDAKALEALHADGWRIAIVWECSLKGKKGAKIATVANSLQRWLEGNEAPLDILC